MIIRRTRFDDFDDWLETVDWKKVKENTGAPMMKLIRLYIRSVGKFSELVGEGAMYLLLAMMGILLYSIITNAMHRPVIWVMIYLKRFEESPKAARIRRKSPKQ